MITAMIMGSQRNSRSKFGKSSEVRCVSSTENSMMINKVGVVEERRKLREAEKVEKVINLVCWGPNKE